MHICMNIQFIYKYSFGYITIVFNTSFCVFKENYLIALFNQIIILYFEFIFALYFTINVIHLCFITEWKFL